MVTLFPQGPPISRSGPLTIVVEADVEASDAMDVWDVVFACIGSAVPPRVGGGYLHESACACRTEIGALCDVGWLEEFVCCAGANALVYDVVEGEKNTKGHAELPKEGPVRLRLVGRMVSERFASTEGVDYDERFEVDCLEVLR